MQTHHFDKAIFLFSSNFCIYVSFQ